MILNNYMRLATDKAVTDQLTLNHALAGVCGSLPQELLDFSAEAVERNISGKNRNLLRKYRNDGSLNTGNKSRGVTPGGAEGSEKQDVRPSQSSF
jgi:hypothetical protein